MSKIADVYAKSLFELSNEEKIDKQIKHQIESIYSYFDKNTELVRVLDAPMIAKEDKENVIDTLFSNNMHRYIVNFIKVMTERKAALYIKEAFESYISIYNKHYNIEKVIVTTAIEMSDTLKRKLIDKLESLTNKTIVVENKVDKNMLGGVVLKFNDEQLDGSIAMKLKNIKEEISRI